MWRKWAAISVIASVLERKVWNKTQKGILYPNLYVVLVGPPGSGKSVVLSLCEKLLRGVDEMHLAPSSVTAASLIDALALAKRNITFPEYDTYNSLQVISSELQNFLPAYEASIMGVLTKIYDCELYEERRRTGKVNHLKIEKTQLSILAGTTPSYLNTLLPVGAWDQGFTSRTIFVYGKKAANGMDLFDDSDDGMVRDQLFKDLLFDLQLIAKFQGKAMWTLEAQREIQNWVRGGEQPVPDHGRLEHYRSRRAAHVLKLGVVAALTHRHELQVFPEDFHQALAWLLEAESLMPEIFRQMTTTPEALAMEDTRDHLMKIYKTIGGPVPEHFLYDFLKHRVASPYLAKTIETMVKSNMLKVEFKQGVPHYTPLNRTPTG